MTTTKSNFLFAVRDTLYPRTPEALRSWIERHIGNPEFGWDYETLYRGLCPSLHQYLQSLPAFFSTALCTELIEESGLEFDYWAPLIETSERLGLAAAAYEDLIFGYRYLPDRGMNLADQHGDTVAGILTASLLATSCNKLLYHNPFSWPAQISVEMFDQCARAMVTLHYAVGIQRSWMKNTKQRPSQAEVLHYAVHGPTGYANSLSFTLATIALSVPSVIRPILHEAMQHLNIAVTILDELTGLDETSATHAIGENFRIGKYTPLTSACTDYLDVPILQLPSFDQMVTCGVIEHAIAKTRSRSYQALDALEYGLEGQHEHAAVRTLWSQAQRVRALLNKSRFSQSIVTVRQTHVPS